MASTFTTLLRLNKPSLGDAGWGTAVNGGFTDLADSAIAGTTTLNTDADVTLTTANGAADQSRQMILNCTGARTAERTITAPAASKAPPSKTAAPAAGAAKSSAPVASSASHRPARTVKAPARKLTNPAAPVAAADGANAPPKSN